MKKNVMMRVAALLLVCVMATTCGISGTFAKYVTTNHSVDTARVAKWGVVIDSRGNMFGQHYNGTTDDKVALAYTGSVDSQGDINGDGIVNIVAPGTKGDMANMQLTGTPEVAVAVTYTASITFTGWAVNGTEEYCPIVITVNGKTYGVGDYLPGITLDENCDNISDLVAKVTAAVAGYSKSYPAGTDLSTVEADALMISWWWPFSTSNANDLKDTQLGNAHTATIEFRVDTTVTQVD